MAFRAVVIHPFKLDFTVLISDAIVTDEAREHVNTAVNGPNDLADDEEFSRDISYILESYYFENVKEAVDFLSHPLFRDKETSFFLFIPPPSPFRVKAESKRGKKKGKTLLKIDFSLDLLDSPEEIERICKKIRLAASLRRSGRMQFFLPMTVYLKWCDGLLEKIHEKVGDFAVLRSIISHGNGSEAFSPLRTLCDYKGYISSGVRVYSGEEIDAVKSVDGKKLSLEELLWKITDNMSIVSRSYKEMKGRSLYETGCFDWLRVG